ncbi:protocadherin gamma-A11-like [Sinocyclocheilus anshuiensis]|uniref:protocadherin gamma-A11-like n=1 Tax=Sinocyclocheilus anshuiensis TaxID=1608454 RepID=UPI0007B982DA|nr:PREDICTED: protocadherin gamma-A11-like [Sinocyclocheilus anshuiensis]
MAGPDAMIRYSVLSLTLLIQIARGQVSYSIPEELIKGSMVGNIAQDLGLDLQRLKSGKARIFTRDSTQYIELNRNTGLLLIREKMDRESLCAKTTPCALHLQMILENPMELYTITIEITDINDNAPSFQKKDFRFEISESAVAGAGFMLGRAFDPDVGSNALQSYSLKPSEQFRLGLHNQADGSKNVEMILQRPLDRETQSSFTLLLEAFDGGDPVLSGTVQIHITVLDINDNAPVFMQKVYKTTITENAPKGTVLTVVSASDADEGSNSVVTYYISDTMDSNVADVFLVKEQTGELILNGHVDFEKVSHFELNIQAKDQGGLLNACKVIIAVLDINDNSPSIQILSSSHSIPEDSKSGTVVAMLNVDDLDSGVNGQVQCIINENIPFAITSQSSFFSLQTEQELDREREAEYNISVICTDEGVPALSSNVSLRLQISDVNDNAPVFEKSHYEACVLENNTPGLSIVTVIASDVDWNQNARVSYILEQLSYNNNWLYLQCHISLETNIR